MMLSFLYKNLLKNTAITSLKSPQLCLLNQRYFFGSEISERRKESIFALFKIYGFTETQISTLIRNRPVLLSSHQDKILKPKLDFFNSYGFSPADLDKILTTYPRIMQRSLDNHIIPSCELMKSVLRDNWSVIAAINRSSWVLGQDLRKTLEPNIAVLRDCGLSDDRIQTMLRTQPRTLLQTPDRFILVLEEIKGMGFELEKSHFIVRLQVLARMSKSTFKQKWDLYRKWGWSDDEIISAFRRQPYCMSVSEEKFERVMVFLVNRMGWDKSKVASCPSVVMHSLDKRTIPQCLVVQFLLSKGVIEKDLTLNSFIPKLEKQFLEKFVVKYCTEFPEVLNLYGRIVDDIQKLQVS